MKEKEKREPQKASEIHVINTFKLWTFDINLYHRIDMGHKTDPLDFILDPGNSVKRQVDLNKARKLAREVT